MNEKCPVYTREVITALFGGKTLIDKGSIALSDNQARVVLIFIWTIGC